MRERSQARGMSLLCMAAGLGAAGCVSRADLSDRVWREVRTDRIQLVTDLDGDDARERAGGLEHLASVLADLYAVVLPHRAAAVRPIRVVHLSRCDELRQRYGEDLRGLLTRSADFDRERVVVTCESEETRDQTVLHELTHDLNHRYFDAGLPAWLEEGLATYYETLEVQDGFAIVGRPPRIDRRFWNEVAVLPRMPELMAMSQEELVHLGTRHGYFAAWKLTHLLANGSLDHSRRFRRMLADFASGRRLSAAFTAAFGDITDRLADDYRAYHLRKDLNIWRLRYRASAVGGVRSERALRRGEALALLIELPPHRAGKAAAEAEIRDSLERIDREDPSWSGRLYWRALVHARWGGQPGQLPPVALLREYLRREPQDPRGWYALVQAELDQSLPGGHLGIEPAPPPGLVTLEDDVLALVRASSAPRHLDLIGRYYALRHRPKTGLNFALRALALEPGCADCWDTLALLYYRSARVQEALAAQRRAAALSVEAGGDVPSDIQARLDFYERAAREPVRDDAPVTPPGPGAGGPLARLAGGDAPGRGRSGDR